MQDIFLLGDYTAFKLEMSLLLVVKCFTTL